MRTDSINGKNTLVGFLIHLMSAYTEFAFQELIFAFSANRLPMLFASNPAAVLNMF
jgi:hypothetical protein